MRKTGVTFLCLIGLCTVAAQDVRAADRNGAFAVDGIGAQTCNRFLEAVEGKDERLITAYASWLNGFMTAYNVYSDGAFDVTPWQTTELLMLKMQAFCNANKDVAFINGVGGLIRTLEKDRLTEASEQISVRNSGKAVVLYRETLEKTRQALAAAGYEVPPESGDFDESFSSALSAYQEKSGLGVTGLPDQPTLNALFP